MGSRSMIKVGDQFSDTHVSYLIVDLLPIIASIAFGQKKSINDKMSKYSLLLI